MFRLTAAIHALALTLVLAFCRSAMAQDAADPGPSVKIDSALLDAYAGFYRLPSGAHFEIRRDGERLLAGAERDELTPQAEGVFRTTRTLTTITFVCDDAGRVVRLDYELAKRPMPAERVDAAAVEDPCQLVEAGGHRLRMLAIGSGGPTVVIEDGFGSSIEMSAWLQAEISRFTRVVAYDHAGTGGSEAGPAPRDARQISRELHAALQNANLPPPYVLVGGSVGGQYMLVFADQYPDDVGAIVMLDPTPDWDELLRWADMHAPDRAAAYRQMWEKADQVVGGLMAQQAPGRGAEWQSMPATWRQFRDIRPLSHIEITQITGAAGYKSDPHGADKVRFFEHWLKEHLPHAKHVLAEQSGHGVFHTEPELVLREIRAIVAQLNANNQ